jgi:hypothetical protein
MRDISYAVDSFADQRLELSIPGVGIFSQATFSSFQATEVLNHVSKLLN